MSHKHCVFCGEEVLNDGKLTPCNASNNTLPADTVGNRSHAVQSDAPLQPGATQPEHDVVAHETAPMTAAHIPLGGIVEHRLYSKAELTTLLERMARLVVQEAVSAFERGAKLPFGCANDNVKAAIRAIANDTKLLQQLREAVERP